MCGHATMAASHFLFSYGLVKSDKIEFTTAVGVLTAKKWLGTSTSNYVDCQTGDAQKDYFIELDFPVIPIAEFNSVDISEVSKCLNGAPVIEVHKTTTAGELFVSFFLVDCLCVFCKYAQEVVERAAIQHFTLRPKRVLLSKILMNLAKEQVLESTYMLNDLSNHMFGRL